MPRLLWGYGRTSATDFGDGGFLLAGVWFVVKRRGACGLGERIDDGSRGMARSGKPVSWGSLIGCSTESKACRLTIRGPHGPTTGLRARTIERFFLVVAARNRLTGEAGVLTWFPLGGSRWGFPKKSASALTPNTCERARMDSRVGRAAPHRSRNVSFPRFPSRARRSRRAEVGRSGLGGGATEGPQYRSVRRVAPG